MKKKRLNRRFLTRLKLLWSKRFGVAPLHQSLDALNTWFHSSLGSQILSREQDLVDEQLEDLFGFHLMQLSVAHGVQLSRQSRISHKFALYPKLIEQDVNASEKNTSPKFCSAVSDFGHLPLPANSIDLVIVHHLLDYSQNPHHLLREVSSVLVAHGHLIVIGFNPWSLFGVRRWLSRWFSRSPQWRLQGLSIARLSDWMRVLDLEPVAVEQCFYLPSACENANSWLVRFEAWCHRRGLPCGGIYLIVARKDTYAVTPQKPHWQTYYGFRAWGVTKILGRATRTTKDASLPQSVNKEV